MNFMFWSERFILFSPLSLADCQRSLGMALGGSLGAKPFMGSIKRNKFRVFKRQTYRAAFFPELDGTLSETAEGTVISCKFSLWRPARIFMYIFYSMAGVLIITALANSYLKFCSTMPDAFCHDDVNAVSILLPVFLSFSAVILGWCMSGEDKAQILSFVCLILDAKSKQTS